MLVVARENQKQRTREALLDAALLLSRRGHRTATIAEVAEVAQVSTATAYRYFPNPHALWAELASWQTPRLAEIVAALPDDGSVERRLDAVIRLVARMQFADEALWRAVLRATLDRWFQRTDADAVRGGARLDATRQILAPLADRLTPAALERLINAVMLVHGVEAMVASRDALNLDHAAAADVMSWAATALVRSALSEA